MAVLTNIGAISDWVETARSLPGRVFGDSLLPHEPQVAGVHIEHANLDARAPSASDHKFSGAPLLPHTDGYMYGDHYPDYIMMLMETQSDRGGENFIVDGEAILTSFQDHPLSSSLLTLQVDLSENLRSGGVVDGRASVGPLFRRLGKRLSWRRQLRQDARKHLCTQTHKQREAGETYDTPNFAYQSLWSPACDDADTGTCESMLKLVDAAIQREAAAAPRFKLSSGEAVLIDNWRVLHGREGFPVAGSASGAERRLWRVWIWTKASNGLPDGAAMVGTVHDVDKICSSGHLGKKARTG